MATLTAQQMTASGAEITYAAADAGGDEVANQRNLFLHVKNGDSSSHTVTIEAQYPASRIPVGLAESDPVTTIPAGEDRLIGPLPSSAFSDGDGNVQVAYDDVTSVTVAAVVL